MKVLHFDIVSGISGDMTVGALLDLGAPIEPLREALRSMDLAGARIETERVRPQGIGALRFVVQGSEHDHVHRSWADIRALLERAALPAPARERAVAIFTRLAEAEGHIHGQAPAEVHFHEIGAVDSIVDIVGCALCLDHLAPDLVTSTPALVGRGWTDSQHGSIPLPAPATLELLRDLPVRGLDLEMELTTPTGAAILATQVERFTHWPDLVLTGIGYGAGSRVLPGRANLLRVLLGELGATAAADELQVETNIDNMNPEFYEHLLERLLEAGAHDAWLQPIVMKKSRPGVTLAFLCDESALPALERLVLTESTSIGLRQVRVMRRKLPRRSVTVETPFGRVRVKLSGEGGEVWTAAPEFEDCRARAREHQVALKKVYEAALDELRKNTQP